MEDNKSEIQSKEEVAMQDGCDIVVDSGKLVRDVRTLSFACAALIVCVLALTYGMYKQNKTLQNIISSTVQLTDTVDIMMKEKQLTSQMNAEFSEWSNTTEGKEWIEEFLKETEGTEE